MSPCQPIAVLQTRLARLLTRAEAVLTAAHGGMDQDVALVCGINYPPVAWIRLSGLSRHHLALSLPGMEAWYAQGTRPTRTEGVRWALTCLGLLFHRVEPQKNRCIAPEHSGTM